MAVIQHAHNTQQRAIVTTLAKAAGDIARLGVGSPAISVVGAGRTILRSRFDIETE